MPSFLVFLLACASPAPSDSGGLPETCEDGPTLFGAPNAATGLGDDACGPTCACEGEAWTAPPYDAADIAALRAWKPTVLYTPVNDDPYAGPAPEPIPEDAVCGFLAEGNDTYRVDTYADRAAAEAAGAKVTHTGTCGACSTLEDLAVYVEIPDLTEPVRACGLENLDGDREAHLACLRALGFTEACAWIWYWNTRNTQDACLAECLAALDAPYNAPDGSLNACLQCDEDASGPVFKAVAGRTRRNTGLPNAICRPCSEVTPLVHRYP